jgi:hypothetical protein
MGEVIRFISKSEQERISLILAFQTFSLHWSLLTAISRHRQKKPLN